MGCGNTRRKSEMVMLLLEPGGLYYDLGNKIIIFPRIVALLGITNGTGFDGLAVDDCGTGVSISPLLLPHLYAEGLQVPIPDAFVSPASKVPVD
jgi:hypothetical protein